MLSPRQQTQMTFSTKKIDKTCEIVNKMDFEAYTVKTTNRIFSFSFLVQL